MKNKILIIAALIAFNFNLKAQGNDDWSIEKVLWVCKTDTAVKLTYRTNLCGHNGLHPSFVELNLPYMKDTVDVGGTLSVSYIESIANGTKNSRKIEIIGIKSQFYSNQFSYDGVLNFLNISFDGNCFDPKKVRIKNTDGTGMGTRG